MLVSTSVYGYFYYEPIDDAMSSKAICLVEKLIEETMSCLSFLRSSASVWLKLKQLGIFDWLVNLLKAQKCFQTKWIQGRSEVKLNLPSINIQLSYKQPDSATPKILIQSSIKPTKKLGLECTPIVLSQSGWKLRIFKFVDFFSFFFDIPTFSIL